jgi:2-polyprenyl-3-methyl-5-hydroxy-6-metoxy-1,4-benzoquinol methylase/glycosyltransferase involved in cell wall biosynthesis
MLILDHAAYDERSIAANLGAPEYSYWFVRKAFRHVLERFGTVHGIGSPDLEVDPIYRAARERGEPCVFLSYNPPQYVPLDLECPTFPVCAWEYDRIPDEVWSTNRQDDWRVALAHCGAAITHSRSAARAIRHAMGDAYRVWSIPAPVHAFNKDRGDAQPWRERFTLRPEGGLVIDIASVDLSLFRANHVDTLGARAIQMLRRRLAQGGVMSQAVELSGVIYTTIFNPADGRKNWGDLLTGFVWAFRDNPDATLVVKITQVDVFQGLMPVMTFLGRLGRFRCRILIVHGLLSEEAYSSLVDATSYVVNTSYGEGQCLPLMEFMSSGRPAIAPKHSAMTEYVTPDNAFEVGSFSRLIYWPHDPREARRCHHREISFTELVRAYRESFRVARNEPDRYRDMAEAARIAMSNYCGDEVVSSSTRNFLEYVTQRAHPIFVSHDEARSASGEETTFRDAWMAGWYQADGELYHGFDVGTGDAVLDLGSADPSIVDYCRSAGATVARSVWNGDTLALDDGCASRIICLDGLSGSSSLAARVSELARIGWPGARYLLAIPSAFSVALSEAAGLPAEREPPMASDLRELIERAGLNLIHEDQDGFFRALSVAFQAQAAQCPDDPPAIVAAWNRTWGRTLAASPDGRIQRLFDRALPGRHLFVAMKGERIQAERQRPRPDRPWRREWSVPGRADIILTDPFAQGMHDAVLDGWFKGESGELAPGFAVSSGNIVLDFGCGGGGLMGFCAARGAKIILADASATAVEEAKAFTQSLSGRTVEALVSDGDPLLLPNAAVNRIVCTEVLEHVEDPGRIMAELARVGMPGALYLLTVPAADVEAIQMEIGPTDYSRQPHHIRVFEGDAFKALVEGAGLRILRTTADGFFWSIGLFHVWTKGVRPGASSLTLDLWGAVWHYLLHAPHGLAIKRVLDSQLPKRQIIVAQKVGG